MDYSSDYQKHYSKKSSKEYNKRTKELLRGRDISEMLAIRNAIKNSHKEMDRRLKAVWLFITGKDTSILSK